MEKVKNKRNRVILIVVLAAVAVGLCVILAVCWRGALIRNTQQDIIDGEFYDNVSRLADVFHTVKDGKATSSQSGDIMNVDYDFGQRNLKYFFESAARWYPETSYAKANYKYFHDDSLSAYLNGAPDEAFRELAMAFSEEEYYHRYCNAVADAFDLIVADPYSTEGYEKVMEVYEAYTQDLLSQSSENQ